MSSSCRDLHHPIVCSRPKDWVRSDALLKLTGQKYFDRRIRELRDETGCHIETGSESGLPAYILKSIELRPVQDRSYLSANQKKLLFNNHSHTCGACGRVFIKEERGLEADHRVPLIRGGDSNFENWQPLCVDCNVSKRRSCQACLEECSKCAWAFPEKFGMVMTIRASKEIINDLKQLATAEAIHPQELILNILQDSISKKIQR